MKKPLPIILFIFLFWSFVSFVTADDKVLLPLPSEALVQKAAYVYVGLDDGVDSTKTYYLYENSTTSTAGSVSGNVNEIPNFYDLGQLYCLYTWTDYRFQNTASEKYLAPNTSATTATFSGTSKSSFNGITLQYVPESSTPERARFWIRTTNKLSDGEYYYLSWQGASKWYKESTHPIDQIATKTVAKVNSKAALWTFFITPNTSADIEVTFKTLDHGYIGWSTSKTYYQTALSWPKVTCKNDYAFTGWYDNEECMGDEYVTTHSTQGYFLAENDITLYGRFIPQTDIDIVTWTDSSVQFIYYGAADSIGGRISLDPATEQDWTRASFTTELRYKLSDLRIDNHVYELPLIDSLSACSNRNLFVTFYDQDGFSTTYAKTMVPSFVRGTQTSEAISCSHVEVLNGGVLTVSSDMTVKSMTIYGGGKVVVPQGVTLTITDQLILRGGEYVGGQYAFVYPQLVANGSVITPDNKIWYEYLVTNKQYYSLAVPYPVSTSDIVYRDGSSAQFGLQKYDGEKRAKHESGWVTVYNSDAPTPITLQPGIGYTVFGQPTDGRKYVYLRMPMEVDLSAGEITGTGESYKTVSVSPWGDGDATVLPNERGWNLVGNPYLANYGAVEGLVANNGIGILALEETGYEWRGELRYVIVPNNDGSYYLPMPVERSDLSAFRNFFVQIGAGDALRFTLANRVQHSPRRRNQQSEIGTGIVLTNNQEIDYAGIVIGADYSNAYEYNADLNKWKNKGLNIYSIVANNHLCYAAIDTQSAQFVALGYSVDSAGTYTIRFDDSRYDKSLLEALYLLDQQTGKEANLLEQDYTFITSGQSASDSRFVLRCVPIRKQIEESTPSTTFDYTDLDAALCRYSLSVDDPTEITGKVDFGPNDWRSRHTVCTDVTKYDLYTGNQLRTTLPDGRPAVRLGNTAWSKLLEEQVPYRGSECITYTIPITEEEPLLVLYYAAVLQLPDHVDDRPRFTMQIYNEWGFPLSEECYSFDFTAGSGDVSNWTTGTYYTGVYPGANSVQENPSVTWKDWTMMSVDLTDYIGTNVRVRLSTYDCGKYGHYGYAYFGLDRTKEKVTLVECGNSSGISTFKAPMGFLYEWTNKTTGAVVSYKDSIDVANDGTVYQCKVMNKENPNCYFMIERKAESRFPIASFDTIHFHHPGTCQDTVLLVNTSYVALNAEGTERVSPEMPCDDAEWHIQGPGGIDTLIYDYQPDSLYLVAGGEYTITLKVGIDNWACESMVEQKAVVNVISSIRTEYGDATICEGDYLQHGLIKHYEECDFRDTVPDIVRGCHDTIVYVGHLTVNPVYTFDTIHATICRGDFYVFNGRPCSEPGVYVDSLQAVTGCDSIRILHLHIYDNGKIYDSLERMPHRISAPGSWRDPFSLAVEYDTVCNEPVYIWKGHEITEGGIYRDTVHNIFGCDSISYLYLEWKGERKVDTITSCEQDTFVWRGDTLWVDGIYRDTTYSEEDGCFDTIYTLYYHREIVDYYQTKDTTCEKDLPYFRWRNRGYTLHDVKPSTSLIEDVDTVYTLSGCIDSICLLSLLVQPITELNSSPDTVCIDSIYTFLGKTYLFHTEKDTTIYDTLYYLGSGCDSVHAVQPVHVKDCCPVLEGTVTTEAVCADDEKIYITFSDFEEDVTQYSLHFDSLALLQGWRDTAGFFEAAMPLSLDLPIPMKSDSLQYVRPDNYRYTLLLKGVCHNYLELVDTIQVYYPSWIIEQRWSDVLAIVNSQYNGGYEFSAIQWYHEGYPVEGQGAHQSYLLQRPHLTYGDDYWAELTRVDDGKTIRTCIVQPVEMSDSTEIGEWGEDVPGEYWTYYIDGRLIGKGICPINRGVYVILWRGLDGTVKTYKLLKD